MQQGTDGALEIQAGGSPTGLIASPAPLLDAQLADLIETVWACERQWKVDDRIDSAIHYAKK